MPINDATGWNTNSLNSSLDLYTNDGEGYLLSVHDGDPDTTGANMVTGVDRVSCSFDAASNGQSELSSSVTFNMSAGDEVHWVGRWLEKPADTFTFHGYKPAATDGDGNMVPVTFEVDGTLTVTEHTLGAIDIQPS